MNSCVRSGTVRGEGNEWNTRLPRDAARRSMCFAGIPTIVRENLRSSHLLSGLCRKYRLQPFKLHLIRAGCVFVPFTARAFDIIAHSA